MVPLPGWEVEVVKGEGMLWGGAWVDLVSRVSNGTHHPLYWITICL